MLTSLRRSLARLIAPRARAYAGAQGGRLYADWITAATSADAEIRRNLRKLIDRSRDLERNNDYMRGFLLACHRNINGSHRYDLRADAGEYVAGRRGTAPEWQSDALANRLIEQAWTEWCKKEHCTTTRKHSWRKVRKLCVRAFFRDGNVLVRKIRGEAARNPFGFRIQLWEVDHLDLEKFQERTREGREIRFGIETDADGAHVAYWVRAHHPGDTFGAPGRSLRVTADEFYHMALDDRSEQTVGIPAPVSAITRLRQLGAFEEAAVIAARLGASKAGFFKNTGEAGEWEGETGADGRPQMDVQPGTFDTLPNGWDVATWDPQYPNIETGDFRKAMLRGVCASLGVSYTTLGNDLEAVNYSSARIGLFDEREGWKDLQLCFSEDLWEPIFADWLEQSILSGALNLPLGKFAKFNRPVFKARRWAMIDPVKEMNALESGIALRVQSRRGFIEEQGGDVEEVFHDNKADEQIAKDIGITLPDPAAKSAPPAVKLAPGQIPDSEP